ncbi:enoyl-CoA hydratase/isomerase family protein [Microbacterium sp. BWT-B31]|uniref:enoyl-CoA hydratase/isomerase family protein n=1 Tax=Microbacterium sp. BWT-B31 TaxID=3232072 RepID=UPI0035292CA0
MTYTTLTIERDDSPIRNLIIDVPDDPLNLLTPQLHHDLLEAFRELRQDLDARAIIMSARGKAFSGGGHMEKLFADYRDLPQAMRHHHNGREILTQLVDIPVPVIAAVGGVAAGFGCSLAMVSDFIVMAEGAVLVDPHVRAGIVAGDGGTIGFPYAMSMQQAKKHLMMCRPLHAEDALRLGLAIDVVPREDLLSAARRIAEEIAALPPLAVRHTKQALNAYYRTSMPYAVELASAWEHVTFRTQDHREAVDSFLEKRSPEYEGR